jgi:NTP pyrophosphatase (non-canonical NTP hydrolase)
MINLKQIQKDHLEWATNNFGARNPQLASLGVGEEIGELIEALDNTTQQKVKNLLLQIAARNGKLQHSQLKSAQNIRGNQEKHLLEAKDAIVDITIYLIDICNALGFDYSDIIQETWDEVKKRNWKKNQENGVETLVNLDKL